MNKLYFWLRIKNLFVVLYLPLQRGCGLAINILDEPAHISGRLN